MAGEVKIVSREIPATTSIALRYAPPRDDKNVPFINPPLIGVLFSGIRIYLALAGISLLPAIDVWSASVVKHRSQCGARRMAIPPIAEIIGGAVLGSGDAGLLTPEVMEFAVTQYRPVAFPSRDQRERSRNTLQNF
jgi:hypothetical protein